MPDYIIRAIDPEQLRADITAEVVKALKPLLADSQEPRLVDGDRMAELAGVSRPTIDRAVRDGIIPSLRIGRRRLFEPRAVIDAWANANEKATGISGGQSENAPDKEHRHDTPT
jgi:excisionase family DNA binding protein